MRKIPYDELVEQARLSPDTLAGVTFALLAVADRVDALVVEQRVASLGK